MYSISIYRQKLNIKFISQSLSHFSSYGILIFLLLFVFGQPLTQGTFIKVMKRKPENASVAVYNLENLPLPLSHRD